MPSQHSDGYQRRYQGARSKSASWVREHLPAVWAAALGGDVDVEQVRAELRGLADAEEVELP